RPSPALPLSFPEPPDVLGRQRTLAAPAALPGADGLLRVLRRDAVLAGRQLDAGLLELRHERRADAGGLELADDLPVDEVPLLELEDVLGQDIVVLHPLDLRDVGDLAR